MRGFSHLNSPKHPSVILAPANYTSAPLPPTPACDSAANPRGGIVFYGGILALRSTFGAFFFFALSRHSFEAAKEGELSSLQCNITGARPESYPPPLV